VVFVCENNQYAMSMPVARAFPIQDIAQRAAAYAMPGKVVDGNDILAIHKAVAQAVERARAGKGPSLIECKTYRWKGHSKSDQERYRTREEVAAWKQKDPVAAFEAYLMQGGIITQEDTRAINKEAQALVDEALAFAESSPEPRVEEISEGVYA
jgi:TPP-dependent pyruvate/acetoin dehydrogenase alpha subunit